MDIHSSSQSNPIQKPRSVGRAKSCTHCRQAKVACDARKTLSGPCSRCNTKNLVCRLDANFKRIPTRRVVENFTNEFHALSSGSTERTFPVRSKAPHSASSHSVHGTKAASGTSIPSGLDHEREPSSWLRSTDSHKADPYIFGALNVEHPTVVDLFKYFAAHYHRHVLFLQPVGAIEDLHTKSPFLFWTILLISSQDHPEFANLYSPIAGEMQSIIAPIFQGAVRRLEDIHALLLLSLWPVPRFDHFDNPAWTYVGLATNAAMQLRCHDALVAEEDRQLWAGFSLTPTDETTAADRARTWLACVRVGTTVAAFSGLPLLLSPKRSIKLVETALQTASDIIPPFWKPLFSILNGYLFVSDTLDGINDTDMHYEVTKATVDQLNRIKEAHLDSWGPELEIDWCNARLYLLSLTFTPSTPDPEQWERRRINYQVFLRDALTIASSLITQFVDLSGQEVSDLHPGGLLTFVPELYLTSLFNAATILFRYMATSITIKPGNRAQAMNLMIEAHKIFQSYPDRQEPTRAAIHIESLIDILKENKRENMDELVVKSKGGASIMYDAIFRACRQRNIDPQTGRPLDADKWKKVSEMFAERLPAAQKKQLESGQGHGFDPYLQNRLWSAEWDSYIDLFQVGDQDLEMFLDA